jgi:hypothetical protein
MFIAPGTLKVFQLRRSGTLLSLSSRNVSLLWSSGLLGLRSIYKPSAPDGAKRLTLTTSPLHLSLFSISAESLDEVSLPHKAIQQNSALREKRS